MCSNLDKKIGIFFKRNDFICERVKDLRFEVQMQSFEVKIVNEAIETFLLHHYKKFDALVGDCKCQVRASIFLDIIQKKSLTTFDLKKFEQDMNALQEKLSNILENTDSKQMLEMKKIIKLLKSMTVFDFFQKSQLNYVLPDNVLFIVFCFFTYLKIDQIKELSNGFISKAKAEDILKYLKNKLSLLTIEYEQKLAQEYGNNDIQKILEIIENKGFSCMTAFYPSFIPVWNKIKDKKQLILKKTIFICDCGGIKNIQSELFRADKNKKLEKLELENLNEAAFVIEGYQFNGSFEKLSLKTDLFSQDALIQINDFKLCSCQKLFNIPVIENIEEAILANFAQHRQFTTGVEIDWQGLGLEDSELKKEYDYLRSLPGYNINDMSNFLIVHIYASTVGQELEDQRQILLKLGKK